MNCCNANRKKRTEGSGLRTEKRGIYPSRLTLHSFLFGLLVLLILPTAGAAAPLEVRALLVPEQEAVLSSQISGIVIKLPFEEGERFKEGDTLVELDCRILRAELSKAEMDLEAAGETHGANLRLQEFGSVSELEVAVSSARKKRAQAEVLLTRTRIEMCTIAAPFNGRVVSRQVNLFENIKPEDKLLEILDDSQLKIHLLIPSGWLRWLETGTAFSLVVDETGKKYEARVTGIGARVNPVNQTLEVRAAITGENPELLAGMSGTAFFQSPPDAKGSRDGR